MDLEIVKKDMEIIERGSLLYISTSCAHSVRIVKATSRGIIVVYSIIWTNPFYDLSSYANRE